MQKNIKNRSPLRKYVPIIVVLALLFKVGLLELNGSIKPHVNSKNPVKK
jgi:hypothetical protein